MKIRIFSDIESEHLIRSALYFVIAAAMIALSFPAGVLKGQSTGMLLFPPGLMLFFYAFLRPWGNAKYYLIQYAALFVIFAVLWIARESLLRNLEMRDHMNEDIAWLVGGVCLDGFIGSLAGIIVFSQGLKSLIYSAANIALLAIFIMFPQALLPDPELSHSEVISAHISLIFQFAAVAVFYRTASIEERISPFYLTMLLVSGIVLILMGVWGILAFENTDWLFGIRIWSALEIISGISALYAFAVSYKTEEQAE